MTRTAIAITDLVRGTESANLATEINSAAENKIECDFECERLVIKVINTNAQTATITVKKSDFGSNKERGNLAFTVAQNEVKYISNLEAARYIQSDGDLHIDADRNGGTQTNIKFRVLRTA